MRRGKLILIEPFFHSEQGCVFTGHDKRLIYSNSTISQKIKDDSRDCHVA